MRVIAIKDAPIVVHPPSVRHVTSSKWSKLRDENGTEQAYKVGDIFDLSKKHSDLKNHRTYMVIFNHHIGSYMEVNYENFISLDEYRENQINELLSV
jgi:hypothetical protein